MKCVFEEKFLLELKLCYDKCIFSFSFYLAKENAEFE